MVRWGIAGTGRISNDFALVLKSLPTTEITIGAVAARSLESAQKFIKELNLNAKAYGSYAELANDPNIDIVYIGTVHVSHAPISIQMMNSGKAVLCEKPMSMSSNDAREVLDVAVNKKVLFVEGIWSRFFPVYDRLRQELKTKSIGNIREIDITFGVELDWTNRQRIYMRELGGGVMLDIGCYPIQMVILVFGCEYPDNIEATGTIHEETGVDKTVDIKLTYKDGRVANLHMSGVKKLVNSAKVFGTNGCIEIPDSFYSPTTISTPSGKLEVPLPEIDGKMQYSRSQGLQFEAKAVSKAWKDGKKEMDQIKHEESYLISIIIEQVLKQLGVSYGK